MVFRFIEFRPNRDEPDEPLAVFKLTSGELIESTDRYASLFLDDEGNAAMIMAIISLKLRIIYLVDMWMPGNEVPDVVNQLQQWMQQYKLLLLSVSPTQNQRQDIEAHPIRSLVAQSLPDIQSYNAQLFQPAVAKLELDVLLSRQRVYLKELPGEHKLSALLARNRFPPMVCSALQAIDSPPPPRYNTVSYEGKIGIGMGNNDDQVSFFDDEFREEANVLRKSLGLEPY